MTYIAFFSIMERKLNCLYKLQSVNCKVLNLKLKEFSCSILVFGP